MNILIFLIILFFLVLVHEFGHFIVAKKSGIRVDEFAIGFPPRLWKKKFGETIYSLNLLPIGGFVKIFGENPDQESIEGLDKERSFVHKPKYIQAAVLVAGVAMNMLFAWFLFSVAIIIGLPVPNGYAGDRELQSASVAIVGVLPNSPAQKAGVISGEKIVSISTESEFLQSQKIAEIQQFIGSHKSVPLTLKLKREDSIRDVVITPELGVIEGHAGVGVALGQVGTLKLPFFEAIYEAGKITIYMAGAITIGLFELIKTALIGQANLADIAGPVGIVGMVGEASAVGFTYLLGFAAMISVNLAVLNLLPFPALDGGRLLFVAIEAISRRTIPHRIANALNIAGFAILILLMIAVTYSDITKII
jgi:regulator of sigma E protease